eukprot:CAMPEP_0180551338 /NCGR_PEP_ID=MMETSP1036_2-20121128/73147_1 /TAXON_ID=632150 /ORGANISM="Azadinium spinosum, Strain 3D9" /LENGTH=118 /DNA_ID=CAMNT_0022566695 /DNA_START=85 /DNA_END=445 /DNA_ORIENTATION=-
MSCVNQGWPGLHQLPSDHLALVGLIEIQYDLDGGMRRPYDQPTPFIRLSIGSFHDCQAKGRSRHSRIEGAFNVLIDHYPEGCLAIEPFFERQLVFVDAATSSSGVMGEKPHLLKAPVT